MRRPVLLANLDVLIVRRSMLLTITKDLEKAFLELVLNEANLNAVRFMYLLSNVSSLPSQ